MDSGTSHFDMLVDEAWPAPVRAEAGGWILRHAGGVTKRANSVLPVGVREDLAGAVEEAEKFYAALGLPCVFSIGAGAAAGLDAELERRGYRVVDPTLVMTAPVAGAVSAAGAEAAVEGEAEIEDAPSERWLRTWWSVDGGRHGDTGEVPAREWAERVLTGVPAGYLLMSGGAVGRAVPQGEWLGIYCMAVEPHLRRRGLGTAVLRSLIAWGREQGADRAYLLVTTANVAARTLYERAGFAVAGRYHYRVGP
ncbi:GNAT family N-acetyltransferase [Microbispora sp. NPDC049125]|uniref:GNAT family N-acetyltransferase n=1 Tax=Microbispora sp. NPDC049125 TaxID=3154929 RepID=UPI00346738C5